MFSKRLSRVKTLSPPHPLLLSLPPNRDLKAECAKVERLRLMKMGDICNNKTKAVKMKIKGTHMSGLISPWQTKADSVDFEGSHQRMSNTSLSISRSLNSFLVFTSDTSKNNAHPNYPLSTWAKSTQYPILENGLIHVFYLPFFSLLRHVCRITNDHENHLHIFVCYLLPKDKEDFLIKE